MRMMLVFLLFVAGFCGIDTKAGDSDSTTIAMAGRKLSAAEIAELEKSIEKNPDDIKAATTLLGYYFGKVFRDRDIKEKKRKLVLFLIEKHPEAGVLKMPYGQFNRFVEDYPAAEKLWLEQLKKNPENPEIAVNAAKSFLSGGNFDLAIEYLKKAAELDKENSFSRNYDIGNAYAMKSLSAGFTGMSDPASCKNALEFFETAYAAAKNDQERDFVIGDMAKAALKCEKFDKAAEYADKMFVMAKKDPVSWNSGNLYFYANFVLGMIAVKKGNIEDAEKYLLESGNSSGSPQLNSFGPNMSLAKALLEKGKRTAVLEFLKRCSKFWKNPKCDRWIKELEENKIPDFSIRLY